MWVSNVLLHRAYLHGTRYYETPECFLYFLSRLLEKANDATLNDRIRPLLYDCVSERNGTSGDALSLSMRILTSVSLGICNEIDIQSLLSMQEEDGSWDAGWMYKYGSSGVKIGNRGLTTALAFKAIQASWQACSSKDSSTDDISIPNENHDARPMRKVDLWTASPLLRGISM